MRWLDIDVDYRMQVIHVWVGRQVIQLWWCGRGFLKDWCLWPKRYIDPDDGCELFWYWSIPGVEIRTWKGGE